MSAYCRVCFTGSTLLITPAYSLLVTLVSIEIITFVIQLLIWRLEEHKIIQIDAVQTK
jgi:hypothetical protein